MIRLNQINLKLSNFSLSDINLEIHDNDFFALIGPTGSGKSLLLEGIMGLIPFTDGTVLLDGKEITRTPVEKRNLAIVFQEFALFPHLNVTQNILYGVRYHNIDKKDAQSRFDRLVSTLGLERILLRNPQNLSGGEKQRVALARSLVLNPAVLLLDEPLSALDPLFHEEATLLLKKVHEELKITIIMVSHNFPDVFYLANRGAIIKDGRIMQQGSIMSLFETPNSQFTAAFVGMKNIRPIRRSPNGLLVEGSDIRITSAADPENGATHMGIRPEDISLVTNDSTPFSNTYRGIIKRITSHGVFLNIRLETAGIQFDAVWSRNVLKNNGLETGKGVRFGFHPESVHFF